MNYISGRRSACKNWSVVGMVPRTADQAGDDVRVADGESTS
jgi:hypothetical protein